MSEEDKAVRLKALAREIRDELGEHNVLDALARELAAGRLAITELTQELTKDYTERLDKILKAKEDEIMEV